MPFRKDAEELKNSPEFIKVAYDKYGNPIGVRPVSGHDIPEEKGNGSSKLSVSTSQYDMKIIGQWLGVVNQNILTLRDNINLLENPTGKILPILEDAISKNMMIVNKQIDLMNKDLQNYKLLSNSVLEQLNLVNENFSLLRKEISDNNYVSRQLMAEMDLVKKEVKNSNTPSTEIINMLSSLNENFEILRSRVMEISRETMEMNNSVNEKISSLNSKFDGLATKKDLPSIDLSNLATKEDISRLNAKLSSLPSVDVSHLASKDDLSKMNAKFSSFSTKEDITILQSKMQDMPQVDLSPIEAKLNGLATKEDLDMVISGFISKQEFFDVKNEMEELMRKTAINKDELVAELTEKMRKITKKPKRKIKHKRIVKKKIVRKIRKKSKIISMATVRKMLLKTFNLTQTERVLVVTDHKMERVGNKVYEACRKINGSTVFVVMENMKRAGQEPEDSVSEAMKNTDAIIGVTFYTLKKTRALQDAVQLGSRAFLMTKKQKFSLVK